MKFKKIIFTTLIALLALVSVYAQKPDWSVNVAEYNYSMAIVGVVYIDNEKQADENSMIAAFSGDELRGVTSAVYDDKTGNWNFYLLCYSNVDSETLTFKYYSSSSNSVITFDKTETFVADGISGSPFNPHVWASPLLSESELTSFEIEGQIRSPIVDNNINVVVGNEFDITQLTATFEVSPGAVVTVNGSIQVSGVTANNFSETVTYLITSADGTTQHVYNVNIVVNDLSKAEVSTVMSLNDDGVNDYWIVKDVEKFENATFYIMNSYGHIVMESIGYDNTWDGTYDGKLLPTGTYYYIIKVPDGEPISGTISIIR